MQQCTCAIRSGPSRALLCAQAQRHALAGHLAKAAGMAHCGLVCERETGGSEKNLSG